MFINERLGVIERELGNVDEDISSYKSEHLLDVYKRQGTKGEDRNSFVSIHRNKFAVQKQRLSDGAMKKRTLGEAEDVYKRQSPRSMATSVLMPTPASSEKFQLIDLQTLPALFNHLS